MSGEQTGRPASRGDVHHLLREALDSEDRRLDALEERIHALGSLDADEGPNGGRDDEAEIEEARRLVAESGGFLRQLQEQVELLEASGRGTSRPAPDPRPVEPSGSGPRPVRGAPGPPSDASARPAPERTERYDLTSAFGGGGGEAGEEPAWARVLRSGQERLLAALERVEMLGRRHLEALDRVRAGGDALDPGGLAARAERAERALDEARAELASRDRRLAALEARVADVAAGRTAPAAGAARAATQALRRELRRSGGIGRAAAAVRETFADVAPGAAEADPAALDSLQERLVAMGDEHQALVEGHARLLERLVGVVAELQRGRSGPVSRPGDPR